VRASRTAVGRTAGHAGQPPADVHAYTLEGGGLGLSVWSYGASLVELRVPDRDGRAANVVARLPDLAAYESRRYMGATLGRYARCIARGGFELDGRAFQLELNEGAHHVHGGPIGFDRFVWDADAEHADGGATVRLRLERPDGDQGYPGAVRAEVAYTLDSERRLTIEHRATTSAPTVVALTNHAYWNLAGGGAIDGHELAVNSRRVLMVDDELIPVPGPPLAVDGTDYDFRTRRPIGAQALDHCFVLDDPAWCADLSDPASGRTMRVITDQPGLQIHSADGWVEPRTGLALQTGAWPDSPRRPDFPSSRLDPGEEYVHRTTHEFSVA
jgi:aldose 1-epimerase